MGRTGMERGCVWGNGCPRQCADDFSVELYTLETSMVLPTNVTSTNSII